MVKSGLDDRPSVSHICLTFHLSGALILLLTCLWQAFKHIIPHERKAHSTPLALPSVLFFAALYIQIAAGAPLAGLKAGAHIRHVSPHVRSADSGRVVQLNAGLDQPTRQRTHGAFPTPMVCFHRLWVAKAVWLYFRGRGPSVAPLLRTSTTAVLGIALLQVLLGIATVVGGMPIALASLHQATAVALFGAGLLELLLCNLVVVFSPIGKRSECIEQSLQIAMALLCETLPDSSRRGIGSNSSNQTNQGHPLNRARLEGKAIKRSGNKHA